MSDLFIDKMLALAEAFQQELFYDEDHAAFKVDDLVYDFSYDESNRSLFVFAVLADIEGKSKDERLLIYTKIVKAQYCLHECLGFIFGVDPEEKMVNLQTTFDLNVTDCQGFVSRMEIFVNLADAWAHILANTTEESRNEKSEPIGNFNELKDFLC